MMFLLTESLSDYIILHKNELIVIGIVICVLLLTIIYFTFFRRHRVSGYDHLIEQQFLEKKVHSPSKEEILNSLVEFDKYPSFIVILTGILNQFSMEYLYSYAELSRAFNILMDFPRGAKGISPRQRAAMITMVRIFMTSEFIRQKCGDLLDENFDRFLEEASQL